MHKVGDILYRNCNLTNSSYIPPKSICIPEIIKITHIDVGYTTWYHYIVIRGSDETEREGYTSRFEINSLFHKAFNTEPRIEILI